MKESILFISNSSLWPLNDGKRQRTWFLVEALSIRFNVDFLLIGYEEDKLLMKNSVSKIRNFYYINLIDSIFLVPGYPDFFLNYIQKKSKFNLFNEIDDLIKKLCISNNYKFLFSRYIQPLFLIPKTLNIKVVCDLDDVYKEVHLTKIKNETFLLKKIKLIGFYLIGLLKVKKINKLIDFYIYVKDLDKINISNKKSLVLPNLPFDYYRNRKIDFQVLNFLNDNINFGFIGKLSYKPNYQGLIKFINSIWNEYTKINENSRLIIAGSGNIPAELKQTIKNSKNIDLIGFVEDTEVFWKQISVLVVPIFQGGGSNIKIAEALINGKTVISSKFSLKGYEIFKKESFFKISNSNEEWIENMLSINKDSLTSEKDVHIITQNNFDLDKWNMKLINFLS